jgi:hypothetical protein
MITTFPDVQGPNTPWETDALTVFSRSPFTHGYAMESHQKEGDCSPSVPMKHGYALEARSSPGAAARHGDRRVGGSRRFPTSRARMGRLPGASWERRSRLLSLAIRFLNSGIGRSDSLTGVVCSD